MTATLNKVRGFRGLIIPAALVVASAVSADTPINAGEFPAEALALADSLAPSLADSIKTCEVEKANAVHEQVQEFLYRKWSWTANFEKLKSSRVCFQMLSDIAATTRLVTNRFSDAQPHAVAGAFDANYAACYKLANPADPFKGIASNTRWPARFGPEPVGKSCKN